MQRLFSTSAGAWLRTASAFLGGLALVFAVAGCVTELLKRSAGFDARTMSLQTVSLFNQRTPSRLVRQSWKGDWLLRRERLDVVDRELRNLKPDVIMMQNAMARIGSQSESDQKILAAGALSDYEWLQSELAAYTDSQESESLATAVGVPLHFFSLPGDEQLPSSWSLGSDGWMMSATIDYEEQPIEVFNVQLPSKIQERTAALYGFVQERIKERLEHSHHCGKRVVVAGYLPDEPETAEASALFGALGLKDTATGFCQVASRCYTATPNNEIFLATIGDETPSRVDRIYVHKSAYVYSSGRTLDESDATNRYAKSFGMNRLWATQRFGWAASIRLARCSSEELR